jgi:selenocysteine lyase/cysteine desulfurase
VNFEEARAQFPVLERYAYLNAGTNGPLARATVEAMTEWNQRDLAQGRGGKAYFEQILALRERAREALAGLLELAPENVALVSSTTNACNVVLAGLDLTAADEIVTSDVEHFGLLGPLLASPAKVRLAHIRDSGPEEAPRLVSEQVTSRTKLIALSHVSWVTGNSLLPSELPRRPELPILVDGAQSAGVFPTGAGEFDFYTVSGQKWLGGPEATGALYVRDPEALGIAFASYLTQQSIERDGTFVPREGAARFDSGWQSTASLAGLEAALDSAPGWRFDRAAEMTARCRDALAERVELVGEPGQGTLVSFAAPRDPVEDAARLYDAGVVVRDLPGTGWLRASCGYWTNEDDVERLVAAVR